MKTVPLATQQEVWQAFQAGREEAFSFLFHTFYNDLYSYALKIAGNEDLAKDTLQELFITLWRTRDKLGSVQAVKPYLLKALRRSLLRNLTRRKSRLPRPLLTDRPDIVFSPEELIIRDEASGSKKALLLEQLNGLSRRQREVVYLRYYDGLTYEEIAEVMGVNYQSVMNHLHKALIALRSNVALKRLVEVALALCLGLV